MIKRIYESDRIILRNLTISDADDIYKHIKTPDVLKTLGLPIKKYRLENASEFIKSAHVLRRKKTHFQFAIELIETSEVIGCIGIWFVMREYKSAEIGYWLAKKYWRQGLMTEATLAIMRFGFKELKVNRIFASVFNENDNSSKMLLKNNFSYEGCLRKCKKFRGKYKDILLYSILKEEWKKISK